MATSLRDILAPAELRLTLLTPEDALPPDALARPVSWVHSSDLPDPTPFLIAEQVLLITDPPIEHGADGADGAGPGDGARGDATPADGPGWDAYVARLVARDVTALGFGTEVARRGAPAGLLAACLAHGLPLFEVPYATPFIAIARHAADLLAEEAFARRTWALSAQREISLAALRPDGLSATLAELARQLGHWVALFDASGSLDRAFPAGAVRDADLDAVRDEAARLLDRGARAGSSIIADGETLTLQTLGATGQLRGVLAVGGPSELDAAGQQLVTSVLALAGLALEQNRAYDRAQGRLRAVLLRALETGDGEHAAEVVAGLWGGLPEGPIRVAVADGRGERVDAVAEWLELRAAEQPGTFFHAVDGEAVVLCLGERADQLPGRLAERFELAVGLSAPAPWSELPASRRQAEQARRRAAETGHAVVSFTELARGGVLALPPHPDAAAVARATLAPLVEHDARSATALLESVRVWLELDGRIDNAAVALGVHRHTMRARIAEAQRLLGRDLGGFPARAELWAALLTVGNAGADGAAGADEAHPPQG